jgi:C-terminal processing protease CtpA/Prc
LPAVTIGDITLKNLVTTLAEPNSGVMSRASVFEVNIGGGLMRHFTMFFDYSRSRVTLEPNANVDEPFEFDMSGLGLTTSGVPYDRILVENVRADSPAALVGIKPGDRVVSIDGKPAATMTLEKIRQSFRVKAATYAMTLDRAGTTTTVSIEMRPFV